MFRTRDLVTGRLKVLSANLVADHAFIANANAWLPGAIEKGHSWTETIDRLVQGGTDREYLLSNAPEVREARLAYYADRNKQDTDKAIYRLLSIGVIDTYTIDYQNKLYELTVTKHPPGYYLAKLQEFLGRYTSARQAETLVTGLRAQRGLGGPNNHVAEIRYCLAYLTTYIYDNIRLKRQRAIDDMLALCRTAVSQRDIHAQNLLIRDEIYFYFNAKYSRGNFKEKVGNEEREASLEDDRLAEMPTDPLVAKYIDLVNSSATGEFINNCKHLRGSTMRLLRVSPNMPGLLILKAYSLFILGAYLPILREEAQRELVQALTLRMRLEVGFVLEPFLARFSAWLADHINTGDYDYPAVLDAVVVEAYVHHFADWTTSFNIRFLPANA